LTDESSSTGPSMEWPRADRTQDAPPAPAAPLLAGYILGELVVLAREWGAGNLSAGAITASGICAAGFLVIRWRGRGLGAVVAASAAFALGVILTAAALRTPPDSYDRLVPRLPCRVEITGTVRTSVYGGDALPPEPAWRRRVVVDVHTLQMGGDGCGRSASGRVLVEGNVCGRLRLGERVRLRGVLTAPAAARFPGDFDFSRYLRSERIRGVLRSPRLVDIRPARGWGALAAAFFRFRDACIDRAVRGLPADAAGLAAAVVFGLRVGLSPVERRQFLRSGLMHIFAVSGLHVGIFAGLVLAGARVVRIPFRVRYLTLPLPLLLYVLVTGGHPAAVRAWLMLTLWSLCKGMFRAVSPFNTVCVAALLLLIVDPLNLVKVGFQYSFVVVTVLVAGWRWVARLSFLVIERGVWTPMRYRAVGGVKAWQRRGLELLGGSVLAWLGSVGLTVWYNGLFIPGNPLVNAVAAPTAWLTVCTILLKLGVGCLPGSGVADSMFAHIGMAPVLVLRALTRFGSVPPACLVSGKPPFWAVACFYAALAAMLFGRGRPRLVRAASVALFAFMLVMATVRRGGGAWVSVVSAAGARHPVVAVRCFRRMPPVILDADDGGTCRMLGAWLEQNGHGAVDSVVVRRWTRRTGRAVAALNVRVRAPVVIAAQGAPGLNRLDVLPSPALDAAAPWVRPATDGAEPLCMVVRRSGVERLMVRFPKPAALTGVTIERRETGSTLVSVYAPGMSWRYSWQPGRGPRIRVWRQPH